MKRSITKSVTAIVMLLSTVSFGSPNLSGQYWFGSLSVDVDTNEPWGKRGTVIVTGNNWTQVWDDNDGNHTFSATFTTSAQPDGSSDINFPGETYNVAWNGDNENGGQVASGVYFYQISHGSFSSHRKMILLK